LLKQVAGGECTVTFVLFRYLVLWFSWYLAGHCGGITSVVVKLTALWKITDGLCVFLCASHSGREMWAALDTLPVSWQSLWQLSYLKFLLLPPPALNK